MKNIDDKLAKGKHLKLAITFYENEIEDNNVWGSDDIAYEIYYYYDNGIMEILEIGAFGDRALVGRYNDKRGRGITEDEMLENIKEITHMTYKEFKNMLNRR